MIPIYLTRFIITCFVAISETSKINKNNNVIIALLIDQNLHTRVFKLPNTFETH